MVVDAVRTYLDAANGLTELSRRDAVAAARALLRSEGRAVGAVAGESEAAPRVGQSIQALAGELIETSQANRTAIADLVREEVGRQLESMDMVPRDEHERLTRRVAELERRLAARHAVERALAVDSDVSGHPSSAAPDGVGHGTGRREEGAVVGAEDPAGGENPGVSAQDSTEAEETPEAGNAPGEEAEHTPEAGSGADGGDRPEEGSAESAAPAPARSGSAESAPAKPDPARSAQARSAKGKSNGKRSGKAKSKK
ncbi:coiled-coil domain-containing protein [Nocardiopsis kunsanensis]|uniref:Membrane fusogenic activity family protein n=1 Tax=Nocardiopsis kunsanensis TaxID=141693 RepID=A0A918XJB2_9ACTN|nr:hypothetical protein [Nocardiopsis kunsanensis]GHD34650.1 hypothetical protein GCM10007147_40420 [Nocardiopsis kunsanensis]